MVAYEDTARPSTGSPRRSDSRSAVSGTRWRTARSGMREVEIGGEVVMLATPNSEYQSPQRRTVGAATRQRAGSTTPVIDGVLVEVDDLEAHHARAVEAGANVIRPPEDGPDRRLYTAEDFEDTAGCSSSADERAYLRTSASCPTARRSISSARWRARCRRSDPRDGDLPRAPTGGHLRAKNRDGRAAHSRRCSGRDRRDGPWRKVDLPRAGPARLLSDPRPRKAREGRQALRQEPRGRLVRTCAHSSSKEPRSKG